MLFAALSTSSAHAFTGHTLLSNSHSCFIEAKKIMPHALLLLVAFVLHAIANN